MANDFLIEAESPLEQAMTRLRMLTDQEIANLKNALLMKYMQRVERVGDERELLAVNKLPEKPEAEDYSAYSERIKSIASIPIYLKALRINDIDINRVKEVSAITGQTQALIGKVNFYDVNEVADDLRLLLQAMGIKPEVDKETGEERDILDQVLSPDLFVSKTLLAQRIKEQAEVQTHDEQ